MPKPKFDDISFPDFDLDNIGNRPWWEDEPSPWWEEERIRNTYINQMQQQMEQRTRYRKQMRPRYESMIDDPESWLAEFLPTMEADQRAQLAPQLQQMRQQQGMSLAGRGFAGGSRVSGLQRAGTAQRRLGAADVWGQFIQNYSDQVGQVKQEGLQGMQGISSGTASGTDVMKSVTPWRTAGIGGQDSLETQKTVATIRQQMMDMQSSSMDGGGKNMGPAIGGGGGALLGAAAGALLTAPAGGIGAGMGAFMGAGMGGGVGMGVGSSVGGK